MKSTEFLIEGTIYEAVAFLNKFKTLHENFDWEPQPEFAGAAIKKDKDKLSTRDIIDKLQNAWIMLLKEYKETTNPKSRGDILKQIRKLAGIAGRQNISLDPTPAAIGLK